MADEIEPSLPVLPYVKDEPGFKTVTLSRSYEDGFGPAFGSIKLREPTYDDIFPSGLGRPFEWQPGREGAIYVSFPDVVAKYVERLLVSPDQPVAIKKINATDSLRLERAVIGFFTASTA
jgi:hypothetical protein